MNKATTIGSLAQGIHIVDIVAQSDLPLKFSEIQEKTNISKSNLYKYLNTLTHLNLLYRDLKQGHYSLGYKILEYGSAAMKSNDLIGKLSPYFKEISTLTNMSTILAVWINEHPIITNIWNTNYGFNIGAQIGTKLPLLSATGKVFAAYANTKEMINWIKDEQSKIPHFDESKFQQEIEDIRTSHISFAHEPLINHVSSWGLPILDYRKDLVAVITVVGFSDLVPKDEHSDIVKQVLEYSKEMSRIYGYNE